MNLSEIEIMFAGLPVGGRIRHQPETTSTNDLALEAARAGSARNGDIFVADRQTAGRGQKDRRWDSEHALGLWMSIVVLGPPPATPLSFWPGIAVCDYLVRDLGLDAHLKWPNDVLVGRRKIAGILVEGTSTTTGQEAWVIGVGLNLNQPSFDGALHDRATSVKIESEKSIERDSALLSVLGWLNGTLADGPALCPLWSQRSRMPGARIQFQRGDHTLKGRVKGLTPEGYLEVQLEDGSEEVIISSSNLELPFDFGT